MNSWKMTQWEKSKRKHRWDHFFIVYIFIEKMATSDISNSFEIGNTLRTKNLELTSVKVAIWLFSGHFWPLLKQVVLFEAAGAVAIVGSCLESNHQIELNCLHFWYTYAAGSLTAEFQYVFTVFFRVITLFGSNQFIYVENTAANVCWKQRVATSLSNLSKFFAFCGKLLLRWIN